MTKRSFFITLGFCLFNLTVFCQEPAGKIFIIPEPVEVLKTKGVFILPAKITIKSSASPDILSTVDLIKKKIGTATGIKVKTSNKDDDAAIKLQLNGEPNKVLGNEGYQLRVSPKTITITANKPAGLFYGTQSLLQLFPQEIESDKLVNMVNWRIPCVNITDYPRFSWRGLMFDVTRHFFTKEEVKRYIDNMVKYKYNLLHLHLTDDEGWRIEIKSLPKLTEVGGWRVNKVGDFGAFSPPLPNEPKDYGGFYTQEDIKELVRYASQRFVNVLPEIDVPGHSLAAVVSYPELSCTPGAEKYNVRAGEQIMDWSKGAPPIAFVDNTLCPANDKVYDFLDKVISEVAALFPFEYIHMGGDEAPHNFWEKNPAIKALMQREGLKTMEEVQGYFTRRVEKIVQSKGKKFIGWDEILEGNPSKSTALMSWRGGKYGIKSANSGHEVVMSPVTHVYLDYNQGEEGTEGRKITLHKAYQFDPGEGVTDQQAIKGGQANLWTEHVYNFRQAEYMTWPRAMAIAESVWSPANRKNWANFYGKVEDHFKRFEVAKVKYAPSIYDPIFLPSNGAGNTINVELSTDIPGLDIYYSFDNSSPDEYYPKYSGPLMLPKDAVTLKAISYRDGKAIGRLITISISELRARLKKK
jgi:hexosaminidase